MRDAAAGVFRARLLRERLGWYKRGLRQPPAHSRRRQTLSKVEIRIKLSLCWLPSLWPSLDRVGILCSKGLTIIRAEEKSKDFCHQCDTIDERAGTRFGVHEGSPDPHAESVYHSVLDPTFCHLCSFIGDSTPGRRLRSLLICVSYVRDIDDRPFHVLPRSTLNTRSYTARGLRPRHGQT